MCSHTLFPVDLITQLQLHATLTNTYTQCLPWPWLHMNNSTNHTAEPSEPYPWLGHAVFTLKCLTLYLTDMSVCECVTVCVEKQLKKHEKVIKTVYRLVYFKYE